MRVVFRVYFGSAPEEEPHEVWEYGLSAPPAGWSERPLVGQFEEVLRDAPGGPYEFGLRTTRAVYSWGADAAVLTIAGYVALRAVDALISMSVDGGIKGLIRSLARDARPDEALPDRQEMLGTAQWRASNAFNVDYDALQLVAEENRPQEGAWEFVFEDDSQRYIVEMGAVGGIPLASRVRREGRDER